VGHKASLDSVKFNLYVKYFYICFNFKTVRLCLTVLELEFPNVGLNLTNNPLYSSFI